MMPALTLQNLISWTVQVSLLTLIAALVMKLARINHARFHLTYWYFLLITCMALPVIQPLRQFTLEPALAGPAELATAIAPNTSASVVAYLQQWIPWLLVGGIAIKLGFFIAGALRIRYYRKSAIPLSFPKESILSICKLLNRDVEIGVSAAEVGPVTFGWFRPMVLLPGSFLSLDEEAQRAILCHELLHVVRRDWLSNVVEEIIGACLWFHPAIWWVLSQTKLAREQLVDAEVVRLTSARESYIGALLAIAKAGYAGGLIPAPLFLRRRHLTTRMRSLLHETPTSPGRMVFCCAAMTAVLLTTIVVVSSTFPLMASPVAEAPASVRIVSSEAPHVSTIENGAQPPRITHYVTPQYSDAARQAKIEGMVVVEAVIEADGSVAAISVKRSLDPDLDRNAVYAVQQWRFEPGRKHGVSIPTTLVIEMNFQLKTEVGPLHASGVLSQR